MDNDANGTPFSSEVLPAPSTCQQNTDMWLAGGRTWLACSAAVVGSAGRQEVHYVALHVQVCVDRRMLAVVLCISCAQEVLGTPTQGYQGSMLAQLPQHEYAAGTADQLGLQYRLHLDCNNACHVHSGPRQSCT